MIGETQESQTLKVWMLKGPKGARNDREIEERGAEGAKPSAGRMGRILER